MNETKIISKKAKKLLFKLACSGALFCILNHEFGHSLETEEYAAIPLCGGIMQHGYQCGMLWGASLGVGAESFRRCNDNGKAISLAIITSKKIIESFLKRAKSVDCQGITGCDWKSKFGLIKYFITGKQILCTNLIKKWTPEAVQIAIEGLSQKQADLPVNTISCASEVVKRMGASNEEMIAVAGFAGGIGLSGNACGALAAAAWMKSLLWYRRNEKKLVIQIPEAKKTLEAFLDATDSEFLCHKICGQYFRTIDEHTEFIKNGGCDKLINILSQS